MALTLDGVLIPYLDRLRSWGIAAVVRAYAEVDPDDIEGSWPRVWARLVATYGATTAEGLTAADEYMMLKAAAVGRDYVGHWQDGRPDAPRLLPSGYPVKDWLATSPLGMKKLIGDGMDPAAAIEVSQARTARAVATQPFQSLRDTTFNRFLVDSLVAEGKPIPDDLEPYFREVEDYANKGDPTFRRWRRIPSPGACSFCLMLASRSDYTTRDAATYAGGSSGRRKSSKQESGTKFHESCRCTVGMVAEGRERTEGLRVSPAEYARLTTRDAKGNLPAFGVGAYRYTAESFGIGSTGLGVKLPPRAPWAKAQP